MFPYGLRFFDVLKCLLGSREKEESPDRSPESKIALPVQSSNIP
jgi:hypothetical protein